MSNIDTKQTIMALARSMVQTRGYNGLSFRELAKEVGVKSASIHYHFPTKGDLGAALAKRYTEDGVAYLNALLSQGLDVSACLKKYTDIFRGALMNDNRMCLCGIMSAEHDDLPTEVRIEVDKFTDANVKWLIEVLAGAIPDAPPAALERRALAIFAAVEGAQLVARGRGDINAFDDILEAYRASGLIP